MSGSYCPNPSKNIYILINPYRSAYSLSGHVQITLSPHFLSRKPAKVLLQSLELLFEGQSEVSAPAIGYSAVRLCAITRELVPHDHPVLLSNDGDESPGQSCALYISEIMHMYTYIYIYLPCSSFLVQADGTLSST